MSALPTQNSGWGFWGAASRWEIGLVVDVKFAWESAMQEIGDRTQASPEVVRVFLDGRNGRHFADDVSNFVFEGCSLSDAVKRAADRWMTWTICCNTAKHKEIPEGLPYLTGFVLQCEIELEMMGEG